jgi:hypothetical protein
MKYQRQRITFFISHVLAEFVLLALSGHSFAAGVQYYGAYSHAPQGSPRAMGMGGAYTGISDDASSLIYNPSGLALSSQYFDVGSTNNTTLNREADSTGDDQLDGIPFRFQFQSFVGRIGNLAFGIGQNIPYNAEIFSPNSIYDKAKLSISSLDGLIALKLSEGLALGFVSRQSTVYMNYESFNKVVESSVKATSYTFGLSYQPQRQMGFGISYNPSQMFAVDTDLNTQAGFFNNSNSTAWFKSVATPQKTTFGGFFMANDRLTYAADLDFIKPVENSYAVESPFEGNQYINQEIKTQTVQIPHGGIEYVLIREPKRSVTWRLGGYREPARIVGSYDRIHFTMGMEVRIGPLVVNAAMDESSNFTNSCQSLSFVLGDL